MCYSHLNQTPPPSPRDILSRTQRRYLCVQLLRVCTAQPSLTLTLHCCTMQHEAQHCVVCFLPCWPCSSCSGWCPTRLGTAPCTPSHARHNSTNSHSSAPHHQVPVLQAHLPEGLALGAWIGGTQRLAGFVLTIIFVSCLRCVRLPNRVTMTLVLALSLAAAIALASNWPLLAQFPPKAGREWTPSTAASCQPLSASRCLPAIVCQPY